MAPAPIGEVDDFVKRLPKVELHIHVEGTLTPRRRWILAKRNNIQLPYSTLEALEASYPSMSNLELQMPGTYTLPSFLAAYYGGLEVLRTEQDFYDLAMDYFKKAGDMNVRYAAPFFDPQAHTRRGIPLEAIMDGLSHATADAAAELGIQVNWTMCILRDMSPEEALAIYTAAAPWRGKMFNALGLDSNEQDRPPMLFAEDFARARADGLKLTAHCDFDAKNTHEHIRQVVSELGGTGADRLDHGLNAADREDLVTLIRTAGIGMTLCPHAYHRRTPTEGVFPRIRKLFEAGIPITINSDDPTYMHDRWVEENVVLVQQFCGLTDGDVVQLQRNAVEISWAPQEVKRSILAELDALEMKAS